MSTDVDEIIFGLAKRFRSERERLGLTQKELADRLLTSSRTIISYENGDTPPKLDKLILFAGLGGDVGYVLAGKADRSVFSSPSVNEPPSAEYLPARRAAEEIFTLVLGEDDARMLVDLAKRLARHP